MVVKWFLWVSHEYNLCLNSFYDDRTKSVEFHFFFLFSLLFAVSFDFSFRPLTFFNLHTTSQAKHWRLMGDGRWVGTEYESAGIGKKSKPNQQLYNGVASFCEWVCCVLIFARVSCSYLMHSFVGLLSCR